MKILIFCVLSLCSINLYAEVVQSFLFIPQEIYEDVEKDLGAHHLELKPELLDLEVTLTGDKGQPQKVKLGYSQEVLDLSNFVDKTWTDFSFSLQTPFSIDESATLYFINRYKSMDIGKQTLGLGCGQALKIKQKIKKLFSDKGLQLSTKAGQYLNLLGGDYLLVKKEGETAKMIFFRVRDGRWSHRLCAM